MAKKSIILTIVIGMCSTQASSLADMFGNSLSTPCQQAVYIGGGGAVLAGAAYLCGVKKTVVLGCISAACSYGILAGLTYAAAYGYKSWPVHAALPCLGAFTCGGNKLREFIKYDLYETPDHTWLIANTAFSVSIFALFGAATGTLPGLSSSAALAAYNYALKTLGGVVS